MSDVGQTEAIAARKPDYWDARFNMKYYQHVHSIVAQVGADAGSILDVGSRACPYLTRFDWIARRVSLDLNRPYSSPEVKGIKRDFLTWQPWHRFDVVLCLQVLEHVPDPAAFMSKLFRTGTHVVVSVPFEWPENSTKGHLHDPVDEAKLLRWAGRSPSHHAIIRELTFGPKKQRLVAYYDTRSPGKPLARPLSVPAEARRPMRRAPVHRPEPALPRLILHAGLHKTATSTIQAFASLNAAGLRRRGLWYPGLEVPADEPPKAHHAFAHAVAKSTDRLTLEDARALVAHWAQVATASGETVFVSAEPICRHVDANPGDDWLAGRRAYLERLAAILRGFDVTPVLVLRRQDDFIRSLFQENVMKRTAHGALTFAAYREIDRNPTRYRDNLALFEETFGKVTVLIYEDFPRNDRFCEEFFDAIGVEASGLQLVGVVRRSLNAAETLAKQFLNPHIASERHNKAVVKELRSHATRELLARHLDSHGTDIWESQEARARFLAEFDVENEALRARYFPFRDWLFPPLRTETRPAPPAAVPEHLQAHLMEVLERARTAPRMARPSAAAAPSSGEAPRRPFLYRFGFACHESSAAPSLKDIGEWQRLEVGGYLVHTHPETITRIVQGSSACAVVLGDVFACTGERPVDDLIRALIDADDWDAFDALTGRFALLVLTDRGGRILHDPFGARTVFYRASGDFCVGSHSALVAGMFDDAIDPDTREFVASPEYRLRTVAYLPGDLTLYSNVAGLAPNNYYDIASRKPARYWPRQPIAAATMDRYLGATDEYFAKLADHLRGRYQPLLGLTGGVDSRAVLAGLRHRGLPCRTVTWGSPWLRENELPLVREQARYLGCPHELLDTTRRVNTQRFRAIRSLATSNSGFYRGRPSLPAYMDEVVRPGEIFVTGLGGEILRGFYNRHGARMGGRHADELARLYLGSRVQDPSFSAFAVAAMEKFIERANWRAEFFNADPMDLFYWEQRMGMWGANRLNEMDPAVYSVVGLNSRGLYALAFGLKPSERLGSGLLLRMTARYDPGLAGIGVVSG